MNEPGLFILAGFTNEMMYCLSLFLEVRDQ